MPVLAHSTYSAPLLCSNGHLQTIWPVLFRRVPALVFQRERITTSDGDFLDLDWYLTGARRLAILTHGLEGSSRGNYIRGMAAALRRRGWDAVAWNFRGCSGEPNRLLRFYHSGATEDLAAVVAHVSGRHPGAELGLIGFSLGANLMLKYLGERGAELEPGIKGSVAFSVPCDLQSSATQLARFSNRLYMGHFLRALHKKIRAKALLLPGQIDDQGFGGLRTFRDFDGRYTAPLHGFQSAEDYWRRCSCKQFLPRVAVPTLLVNARNDPFLSEACFPVRESEENHDLFLERPASGGHVGFIAFNPQGEYWSETRAVSFLCDPFPEGLRRNK